MNILEAIKIGSFVKVNLDSTKERLSQRTIDALNITTKCEVKDFRITDGKGVGVVLELQNGKQEWFFEEEIDQLDIDGNIIERTYEEQNSSSNMFSFIDKIEYKIKNSPKDLLNPFNYFVWIIFSFKDIF